MYELEIDKENNYLFIKIDGYLSDAEVTVLINKLMDAVKQLRSGFFVINDMRKMKPWSQESISEMKRWQTYLSNSSVNMIIRIVESPMAKSQVHRIYNEVATYKAIEVGSMDEALSTVREETMS